MQAAMPAFNAAHGSHELQMRIGLNTGTLVRGDMGASDRRDYTVIGDTVNRANRYEANAPKGGVLISASTLEAVKELVEVEPLPGLKLKGLTEPVTGYVVKSVAPRPRSDDDE
jgi:adenylate cyclase